jgi:WD40 repeat protein
LDPRGRRDFSNASAPYLAWRDDIGNTIHWRFTTMMEDVTGELLLVQGGESQVIETQAEAGDLSPDGGLVAVKRLDRAIRLWDTSSREYTRSFDWTGLTSSLSFSPDCEFLSATVREKPQGEHRVLLWRVEDGQRIASVPVGTRPVLTGIAPGGSLLAVAVASIDPPPSRKADESGKNHVRKVNIIDAQTGTLRMAIETRRDDVKSLCFSPDATRLATGHLSGKVRLWCLKTSMQLAVFRDMSDTVECLAFSPDGMILAAGSSQGELAVWEGRDWTPQPHGWVGEIGYGTPPP